jgi:hypothetical protein
MVFLVVQLRLCHALVTAVITVSCRSHLACFDLEGDSSRGAVFMVP